MIAEIAHIQARRAALRVRFDVSRQMEAIEETCIPSYLHPNVVAAGVAWMRLFTAARIFREQAPRGPVLDFGAASGELAHLLPADVEYEFVEVDEARAASLQTGDVVATRRQLEMLAHKKYAAIFALDSLEHNENVSEIVDRLIPALRSDGLFILSGPTENAIYRLGRRIAGFSGGYHKTTIYDIENEFSKRLKLAGRQTQPFGLPLFSITWWRK
jgi:2-polyprenyl-3-methyl-5-hydroxy-6-metoxy-1,4-benzoquinol methylase